MRADDSNSSTKHPAAPGIEWIFPNFPALMKISPRKSHTFPLLLTAGLLCGSNYVKAAAFLWDGSDGNDWANPANWNGNAVPSGPDIRINIGAGAAATIDWDHRLIYSAAQGEMTFGGSAVRGLFIANGPATVGNMEITGGVFNSVGADADGMSNVGGNGTLVINGGEYRKTVADNGSGTFILNFGEGTSLLDINAGLFAVSRLELQNNNSPTADTTGVIRLDGGVLSVGKILKTNSISTHNIYLNGGTIQSRTNTIWTDLTNVTWTLQSNSTFEINHTVDLAEAIAGTGGINKTGTGNFTLSGENSFTGLTFVSGSGALVLANNNALGAAGAGNNTTVATGARVVLNDGITITGEAITIAGDGAAGSFGALRAAANSTAVWNGSITTSGGSARIGAQLGGNLIVRGNIDATAGNLTIRTEGTDTSVNFDSTIVTLEGTYTGNQLNIVQGVVKLAASERISNSAVIQLGSTSSTIIRQRFDLNGFNETVNRVTVSSTAASSTHEITNSAAQLSTLTINPTANTEFSGVVTGNLSVKKEGSFSQSYTGISTYTGDTIVNGGTFNVTTTGALNGGGSTLVASGATFDLAGSYQFNIGANGESNSISGLGTLNLAGILNLNLTSAALASGNAWQIVDAGGSVNWNGMTLTSTSGDFERNNGIWTLTDGAANEWIFSETTGVLELSAVPEPTQITLLLAGIAGCAFRRRRTE
jgi:fibronectin-binding autotransporter adhesin